MACARAMVSGVRFAALPASLSVPPITQVPVEGHATLKSAAEAVIRAPAAFSAAPISLRPKVSAPTSGVCPNLMQSKSLVSSNQATFG